MRRPLCLACVVVAALIFIRLQLFPETFPDFSAWEKETVTITGELTGKEFRTSASGRTLQLTLKNTRSGAEDTAGNGTGTGNDASKDAADRTGSDAAGENAAPADGPGRNETGDEADAAGGPGSGYGVLCVLDWQEPEGQGVAVTTADAWNAAGEETDHPVKDMETGYPAADTETGAAAMPQIGQLVTIRGRLYPPMRASNPGQFDQAVYYRCLSVDYVLRDAVILGVSGGRHPLSELLFRVKEFLGTVADRCLEEENAGIIKAMLLGSRGDLSKEIRDLYRDSGIIHVLAISGLHISLIGMGLWKLLRKGRLPLPVCCLAPVGVMLLYGRMTGMSASSFRAVFMFLLQMMARLIRRTYDLLTAVCLAGVLLLVDEPLYLYNSGFLLSFGAVLAIAILPERTPVRRESPSGRSFGGIPVGPGQNEAAFPSGFLSGPFSFASRMGMRMTVHPVMPRAGEALRVPLCVCLLTLPVYLAFYGTFPAYSMLLNLAVLPLMSLLMPAGLLMLGAGAVLMALPGALAEPALWISGAPVRLILYFYRKLCILSSLLPGHSLVLGQSRNWQYALYFAILATGVLLYERMPGLLQQLLFAGALTLLLLRASPGLSLEVLDVGQGDGIFLSCETAGTGQLPWDRTGLRVMIDGGSTSLSSAGEYRLEPFLCARGAGQIDLWVVTHGDEDHTSGLIELLEDDGMPVRIGRIALPYDGTKEADPGAESPAGSGIARIRALAEARGIPVLYLSAGDCIRYESAAFFHSFLVDEDAGRLTLTCLHPSRDSVYTDPNEYSVTLLAEYGNFSALLTGDLEGAGEEDFLSYLRKWKGEKVRTGGTEDGPAALPVTLLKVAHHGSSGATSEAFLSAVRPSLAVISCGKNNRYHHPHQETLDRLSEAGCRIYDTRYAGAIAFRTDGRRLRIKPYRKDENKKYLQ